MKLATFKIKNGHISYGIVENDSIIDVGARLRQESPSLKSVFEKQLLGEIIRLTGECPDHRLDDVQLLPPITDPEKIICIGLNYRAHQIELGLPEPKHPVVIARFANTQVGHKQPLVRPQVSEQFDYEGELAVIIGKKGRAVSIEEALAMVGGYACYNDGTIRDFQKHSSQVTPAKNFPATGSFGPWMVTADEIPDPSTLDLITRLNGERVQQTSCGDMIFSVAELIRYLSVFTELNPGDVICTGTTSGVGSMRKPPLWLKPGDQIGVEISSIGTLSNPVIAE